MLQSLKVFDKCFNVQNYITLSWRFINNKYVWFFSVFPPSRQPYKPIHERQPVCKPCCSDHTSILTSSQELDHRWGFHEVRAYAHWCQIHILCYFAEKVGHKDGFRSQRTVDFWKKTFWNSYCDRQLVYFLYPLHPGSQGTEAYNTS